MCCLLFVSQGEPSTIVEMAFNSEFQLSNGGVRHRSDLVRAGLCKKKHNDYDDDNVSEQLFWNLLSLDINIFKDYGGRALELHERNNAGAGSGDKSEF